jgi:hypothetical protein
MDPREVLPVKLVSGVLYSDGRKREEAFGLLESRLGPIDYKSPVYPFDCTDYYQDEMGESITRQFISFRELIHPARLPAIKLSCNEIEMILAVSQKRKVNLDPGYLDYDKFVLASAKYNGHKIYLDLGIYADLTLHYSHGVFKPSPYCFPDFKSGQYDEAFQHIRSRYKGQIRKMLKYQSVD